MSGEALSPYLALLRDISVKSALLLLAAWALTSAMRRASAAARHLAWLLTFAGLLLLPLLSVSLPPRPVAVLPPWSAAPLAPSPSTVSPSVVPPIFTDAPTDIVPDRPAPPPTPARTLPVPARSSATPGWPLLLCLLWLLGVASAALPFAAGWLLAARRILRCSPVTNLDILALAAEAGRQMDVRRPVSLRSGPSVAVPVTFGLVRPAILLPDEAASWPAECLRVALLHEMAHVRRGDWATQTMARLICALFWHNPLVWPAARMLRAEAERACDDLVLSSGIPAPDYAQHLLAVAAALSRAVRPLPLAVPMAGRGPLESRLRAVLTSRPRRAPSRRFAALAFVLAFIVLVPLAVLRPAARAARRRTSPLMLAPVVFPAPPKAIRPLNPPIKVAIVAPTVPVLIMSTPIGVPPMKLLMPVKAAFLTALTAGLGLPAAHAIPTAPVKPAPAPVVATTSQYKAVVKDLNAYKKAYPTVPADMLHWNILALHVPLKTIIPLLPWGYGGKNPDGVKNIVFYMPNNSILVNATSDGFAEVQIEVLQLQEIVKPKSDVSKVLDNVEKAVAAPRQVQIKFEWVSSATAPNTAPDKNVETLTIMTEEGRKTQASSRHMRSGVGGEETITVLAHLKPGGMVTLDITEHSDTTAHPGETLSNVTQTTVSIKDGETGAVGSLMLGAKPSGQSAERVLFVTPTIIHAAAESPAETRSAPLRDGDIINVNPFMVTHSEDGIERAIATLLAERATKLAGGATLNHPDILRLDARIAELQRGQRAGESGTMKRRQVNPAPNKTP